MKASARLVLLVVLIGVPLVAQQMSYEQIMSLWKAKQYDQALPLLLAYRKKPFGRTWQVDYMIGTSQCHGSAHLNRGIDYLSNVLVYKQVPDPALSATAREIQFCLGTAIAEPAPFELIPVSGQVTDPATVSGKAGYNFISSKSVITNGKATLTPVPATDLKKRIFHRGQEDQALAAARSRLEKSTQGLAEEGFVVICEGFCEFHLAEVPKCLAKFESPLRNEFDMVIPSELVTVYIPEDIHDVPRLAQKLHGITLPLGTLAYSVLEDMSIVGLYTGSCGTLAHELVHLAIKSNFGDSPAWLEEGLASEVAVSGPGAQEFRFGTSWRDATLRDNWSLRPSVAELLALHWLDFAARDEQSLKRVAAIHAMAAVFVRYLDEQKKLKQIYLGIRDRRFPPDGGPPSSDASIVEHEMGPGINQIDADFAAWFQKQKH